MVIYCREIRENHDNKMWKIIYAGSIAYFMVYGDILHTLKIFDK